MASIDRTVDMTGWSAPTPFVISDSSHYGPGDSYGSFAIYHKLYAAYWSTAAGQYYGWTKIDFGSSLWKVDSYKLSGNNWNTDGWYPGAWIFEGSNDDSNWTTLDTRSGITWVTPEEKTFTFTNTTKYRYYRLNVSSNVAGSGQLNLMGIKIFAPDNGGPQMVNFI